MHLFWIAPRAMFMGCFLTLTGWQHIEPCNHHGFNPHRIQTMSIRQNQKCNPGITSSVQNTVQEIKLQTAASKVTRSWSNPFSDLGQISSECLLDATVHLPHHFLPSLFTCSTLTPYHAFHHKSCNIAPMSQNARISYLHFAHSSIDALIVSIITTNLASDTFTTCIRNNPQLW